MLIYASKTEYLRSLVFRSFSDCDNIKQILESRVLQKKRSEAAGIERMTSQTRANSLCN